jgi:uncharacterized protein (TIGR02145 family)
MIQKLDKQSFLTILLLSSVFLFNNCEKEEETVVDIDGNIYHVITIGSQTWMLENLKTTRLNDGTPLWSGADTTLWKYGGQYSSPLYCWYNNDSLTYMEDYGALYNYNVVKTGKICPKGWHVPTYIEWETLIITLGDSIRGVIAGGKLKEIGTAHWSEPNAGANNISGFTALPGGYRDSNSNFLNLGISGRWWGSTLIMSGFWFEPCYFGLYTMGSGQILMAHPESYGFSIRCIKDN